MWRVLSSVAELYYMAPMDNAPSIALLGPQSYNSVHTDEDLAELAVSIADPFVNSRRGRTTIDGRSLHEYVPLYRATHTPMQYVITQKESRLCQADLVFFVFDSDDLLDLPGVLTTDGNAASHRTSFYYGREGLDQLNWKILTTRNCYSPDYKWRKAAEVLVPDCINPDLIDYVAVSSMATRTKLLSGIVRLAGSFGLSVEAIPEIVVEPDFYY